jgi:hypothetical protein
MSFKNMTAETTSAAAIVAHASRPDTVRLNHRMPTSPFSAAPAPGRRGMSQMYCISEMPESPELPKLP